MGADIVLGRLHRDGSSPRRFRWQQLDVVLDRGDHFTRLCRGSGLPMLERVDPYGTLVLSSSEMDQFLAELTVLRRRDEARPHDALLEQVGRLAGECAANADLELRIDGD